ncbi:MAG: NAD(P)/FAD-dependent oxidoreductase [Anaerolineae bacterium]|nr:NAD(P)/FAD-dependent oxidoreductase [Anaerolineae bacterium]
MTAVQPFDVIVLGGGPAGIAAAERAAELGARTALVTQDFVGGMAAHDGPIPVRTLAHAARLVREAQQLERYGIAAAPPVVNYDRLLARIRDVIYEFHQQVDLIGDLEERGVTIVAQAGAARFVDAHTVVTARSRSGFAVGHHLTADHIIICTGGHSRTLSIPGFEHAVTHSDAWGLKAIPDSMVVLGSGATGAQVASIFNAFGTKVTMLEAAPRILMTEDAEVATAVKAAYEANGVQVVEGIEGLTAIEQVDGEPEAASGRLHVHYRLAGQNFTVETALVVMAIGWLANAAGLNLPAAGVDTDTRGYIAVNEYMQTNVPHIFAAGDVNGRHMLVPVSSQEGYYAATNAVKGCHAPIQYDLIPFGSFTNPEYAQVGLTEAAAREKFDVVIGKIGFDRFPRSIIDGRTTGFCKLVADRASLQILGCHLVGERAVETVQLVAAGMKAGLTVAQLAELPLSFPTYVEIVGWAAYDILQQVGLDRRGGQWVAHLGRG